MFEFIKFSKTQSLSLSFITTDQEAPQVTGKSHQDVRSYVRHISVIDNQRTLSQLSHRLEPRRTWSTPIRAALPLPVNKLAVYEEKPSSAATYAQYSQTSDMPGHKGFPFLWLVVWKRGFISVYGTRMFRPVYDRSCILPRMTCCPCFQNLFVTDWHLTWWFRVWILSFF